MNIALDIGHANNTGARGNKLEEHATASTIATHLATQLRNTGHKVTVIDYPNMSNERDLNATVTAINNGNHDISISIHCDSASSATACGAHVCHHRNYHNDGTYSDSARGKKLAQAIAQPLCKLMPGRADHVQARPDRSCKPAKTSLYILRESIPPAVLIECGFISNPHDATLMRNKPQAIAQAIAQGINTYNNQHQ